MICSGWFRILTNMRMHQMNYVFFILNLGNKNLRSKEQIISPVQGKIPIWIFRVQTQSLQYRGKIPIGIFSFKLKVIPIGILGNPYREFCVQTQSHSYRDFFAHSKSRVQREILIGFFLSNAKSPIPGEKPHMVVSFKLQVSSTEGNLYKDCPLKRSIQYRWKSL